MGLLPFCMSSSAGRAEYIIDESFLKFILLKYGWFTVLFLLCNRVIQLKWTLFFTFASIVVCLRMSTVVPCAVQKDIAVSPLYIQRFASAKPSPAVCCSLPSSGPAAMLPALFRPGSHAPCPLPARQPWGSSPERVPGSSMSSFVSYFMESLFLIFFISSQNVGLEFSDMHSLFLYPFPSLQWTGNSLRFCNNRCGSNSSRTQRINQGIQITVSLVKRLNLFSPCYNKWINLKKEDVHKDI